MARQSPTANLVASAFVQLEARHAMALEMQQLQYQWIEQHRNSVVFGG